MTPPTLDTARVSTEVVVGALARDRRRVVADLVALAKPRVVLMVMVTTAVGYYVGLTGAPDYARLVHLLIGTLLAAVLIVWNHRANIQRLVAGEEPRVGLGRQRDN